MRYLSLWPETTTFDSIFNDMARVSAPRLQKLTQEFAFSPALDVAETNQDYTVQLDIPGLTKEDVKIEVHDSKLQISGERKRTTSQDEGRADEKSFYTHFERHVGRFERTLTLPKNIDVDKITAKAENGVLTVVIPKTEEAQPRQIQIQ